MNEKEQRERERREARLFKLNKRSMQPIHRSSFRNVRALFADAAKHDFRRRAA
jgi:hypothetical protein